MGFSDSANIRKFDTAALKRLTKHFLCESHKTQNL